VQPGGTTPDETKAREKGMWAAIASKESSLPSWEAPTHHAKCSGEDSELGSAVLRMTTAALRRSAIRSKIPIIERPS
jgi:hypothetical protein